MRRTKYAVLFTFILIILTAVDAAAAGEDLLSVNKTVFIQIVIFLAAIFVLNALVFKPFIKLIDRREKLTRGAIEEARELEEKVKEIIEEYDAKLSEARARAQEERTKILREAETAAEGIISEARQEASGVIEEAKSKLEADTGRIKEKLKGDVELLARDIASKILGKEAGV
ncbi:MAG: ATP synthase F0 subunit B [Deltaproteobacteria bacterium]